MARLSYLNQELHLGEILQILRQQMPELCSCYEVWDLGVFGSYLRDEADEKSGLLGLKVDPMEMPILKPALGRRILEDVDPVHRDHYYEDNEYSGRGRPGRKITGPHT